MQRVPINRSRQLVLRRRQRSGAVALYKQCVERDLCVCSMRRARRCRCRCRFLFAAAAAPRLLPLRMGPRLCRCRAAIAAACSRTLHHISPRLSLSLALWFFDTAARSVRLAEELETAQSGTEAGSTSRRMHCVQCDAALGRVFVTTTSDMDRFRDNFTFDTDSLGSYKV